MSQVPSVGRAVHYVSHGTPIREDGTQAYPSKCRAATITDVEPIETTDAVQVEKLYKVSLLVTNPTGLFFHEDVTYDEWDGNEALPGAKPQGGSWHWPERV
jgi:hypothetical protein